MLDAYSCLSCCSRGSKGTRRADATARASLKQPADLHRYVSP
jgi:hypothetical protein